MTQNVLLANQIYMKIQYKQDNRAQDRFCTTVSNVTFLRIGEMLYKRVTLQMLHKRDLFKY